MSKRRAHRVVWGDGLLVCPQHFQQQDLYYHELVEVRSTAANPYSWGISEIEFDTAALKRGELGLKAINGILPGGVELDLEAGVPGLPDPRPIAQHFSSTAAVLEVFAGMQTVHEGAENYAPTAGDASRSFETWSKEVLDLVGAGTEVSVAFARPKVVLLFGSENRDNYTTIKIAELHRSDVGGFELARDYIPPCIRLSGSRVLRQWTSELLALLVAKRRALATTLRQVDASRVEFTAQDVTRSLQLAALATQLPVVRHFSESPESGPFSLYLALSQLAGHLSTFSANIFPEELPTFSHTDPRKTFSELFGKLRQLLALTMAEHYLEVSLEARRDGMWIAMLKEPRLLQASVYVLSLDASTSAQEVSNRIPQLSKIASWKQIPKILRSALPGVPLKPCHRPPPQIPIRPRSVYFTVDTSHEAWRQILREKTLAIFLPPPYDSSRVKAQLFAVPASAGSR